MTVLAFVEQGEFGMAREIAKVFKPLGTGGEKFMDEDGESNGNRTPEPGVSEGNRDDSYQAVAGG